MFASVFGENQDRGNLVHEAQQRLAVDWPWCQAVKPEASTWSARAAVVLIRGDEHATMMRPQAYHQKVPFSPASKVR